MKPMWIPLLLLLTMPLSFGQKIYVQRMVAETAIATINAELESPQERDFVQNVLQNCLPKYYFGANDSRYLCIVKVIRITLWNIDDNLLIEAQIKGFCYDVETQETVLRSIFTGYACGDPKMPMDIAKNAVAAALQQYAATEKFPKIALPPPPIDPILGACIAKIKMIPAIPWPSLIVHKQVITVSHLGGFPKYDIDVEVQINDIAAATLVLKAGKAELMRCPTKYKAWERITTACLFKGAPKPLVLELWDKAGKIIYSLTLKP